MVRCPNCKSNDYRDHHWGTAKVWEDIPPVAFYDCNSCETTFFIPEDRRVAILKEEMEIDDERLRRSSSTRSD